jgi:hypothetical protein
MKAATEATSSKICVTIDHILMPVDLIMLKINENKTGGATTSPR